MQRLTPILLILIGITPVQAQECHLIDEKMDALETTLMDHFGREIYPNLSTHVLGEPDGPFQVFFYPEGQRCEGMFTVGDDCTIDSEGITLLNPELIEQAIDCKPDKVEDTDQ